ncbi:hypothetical protein [Pelagicoccus sp. SDUM812003]|uniref:hypothetical protein n=1 Tax=Pelagicoccus sp. SDUM812003 TaxID=3041267 RepID=UPI00280E0F02|nr:hypothetical protein [Pelagicoccus sp. SDUM812003]MDQ8204308.1 hypothetical protein [Pelagicoccus sp. SDUM812003]
MKKHPLAKLLTFSALALALAFTATLATTTNTRAAEPKPGPAMKQDRNTERQLAMREHRSKLISEMKAQDARLAEQIAAIKLASDDQKMDLVVTLLSEMVEQRSAMHEDMADMMSNMANDSSMYRGMMSDVEPKRLKDAKKTVAEESD